MLKKDQPTTPVIFRKFKEDGVIIAIFPSLAFLQYDIDTCASYTHYGQHSACGVDIASRAVLAKPKEYRELKKELQGLGYKLRVVSSMCSHHRDERLKQINGLEG